MSVHCKRLWIDKDESPQPTAKAELYRRKVNSMYMVGSPCYYLICILKPQSDTQCRFILSTVATYAKSKNRRNSQEKKHCAFP